MPKMLPKRIHFLIADAIREETGGKLTVMGLYAGNDIRLQGPLPTEIPDGMKGIAIPSLAILAIITDGHGEFRTQFYLYDPNDKLLGQGAASKLSKGKDT